MTLRNIEPSPRAQRYLQVVVDAFLVWIATLVLCVAVIPGGAGITAAYAVFRQRLNAEKKDPVHTYIETVRRSFVPALPVWLVVMLLGMVTASLFTVLGYQATGMTLRIFMTVFDTVVATLAVWYFYELSVHRGTPKGIGIEAFERAKSQPGATAVIAATICIPLLLAAFNAAAAWSLVGFFAVIGGGITLYIHAAAAEFFTAPQR